MPINASHEFYAAEKKYLAAQTLEEKIATLEEMIREMPGHKGAENLRAELRLRLKKFREKLEKGKKTGKGKKGIRKEGFQVALVGLTNSGKSCLLRRLTNAKPLVSSNLYATKEAELGTMNYEGVNVQMIDFPAIEGKDVDFGTLNTSDLLLIVVSDLNELSEISNFLEKASGKRLVVVNKIDVLNEADKRKLRERMKSKRKNGVMVSCESGEGCDDLKRMIFEKTGLIRIYTKEPGKPVSKEPIVLGDGATIKDVAEKILKGFSRQIKETRLTGPSGKFSNQKVGLKHRVKDRDVVEFKT